MALEGEIADLLKIMLARSCQAGHDRASTKACGESPPSTVALKLLKSSVHRMTYTKTVIRSSSYPSDSKRYQNIDDTKIDPCLVIINFHTSINVLTRLFVDGIKRSRFSIDCL